MPFVEKGIRMKKQSLDLSALLLLIFASLMAHAAPQFCPVQPTKSYAPTVDNPQVVSQDLEGMIPTIKKYAPILYLCKNEQYYPVAAEDYFTAPGTQLVHHVNHKGNQPGKKTIVIPRGQVTMEEIYEKSGLFRSTAPEKDFFFEIDECTQHGSNPKKFSDRRGNLTTPAYVTWNEHDGKIYITYIFAYAYNGQYPIKIPRTDIVITREGAHEFDLEHMVLELNQNKELERIFFAAHGSREGVWLNADDKHITYEGTHPVAFVALNGHGSYPRHGTHVRIFGFANDVTCKDVRWTPQLVLLYPENDSRFNPATMGWVYHSGVYGRRGVDPASRFFGGHKALTKGQPFESVQFCENPKSSSGVIGAVKSFASDQAYKMCIDRKRPFAGIPDDKGLSGRAWDQIKSVGDSIGSAVKSIPGKLGFK